MKVNTSIQGRLILRVMLALMMTAVLALLMSISLTSGQAYAKASEKSKSSITTQAANIDAVRKAIKALSDDPTSYKASDLNRVEAIKADYDKLSKKDRATLDSETAPGHSQSYGRVLEIALWSVWSYRAIDDSTTLPKGTYSSSSNPKLSSKYSKGKSTSSRNKPWSVKSVTVDANGKAKATITVDSTTYTTIWMGGKKYPKTKSNGNCEFADIPIDLNSTFYFAGYSTSMRTYIAFSLKTSITEPSSAEPGYWTVTFDDGFGGVQTQTVKDGEDAIAPADPTHEGYTFKGWSPSTFTNVKNNLYVNAQWVKNEDGTTLAELRKKIAKLPMDPKELLRKVSNKSVAEVGDAYLALSDELKAKLSDDERLHLAMCAIAVLPSDSFDIAQNHKEPISRAEDIYNSLPADLQKNLDDAKLVSSRTYGRYLENAVWALDGLRAVNNITTLKAGTYTGQVTAKSSLGKMAATSTRDLSSFSVKSITVKDGKATAILEHSSNSSKTLYMGGVKYKNLQTDPSKHSYYEVPILLNSTFHFSTKGKSATSDTDAITYEMTVTADESTMVPDDPSKADADAKAAKAVVALIDDLPSDKEIAAAGTGKLAAYQTRVTAAREAYDKLTDEQKALVGDEKLKKLEQAETSIAAAVKAQSNGSGDSGDSGGSNNSGGSGNSSGSGSTDTANSSGGSSGGTAGNLAALVTNSGAQRSSTPTPSSPSSPLASNGASANGASAENSLNTGASAGGANSADASIREVSVGNSASGALSSAGVDLGPAIAGVGLLFVSLGALLFALRFIRRESLAA